jgi:hypothetical protein
MCVCVPLIEARAGYSSLVGYWALAVTEEPFIWVNWCIGTPYPYLQPGSKPQFIFLILLIPLPLAYTSCLSLRPTRRCTRLSCSWTARTSRDPKRPLCPPAASTLRSITLTPNPSRPQIRTLFSDLVFRFFPSSLWVSACCNCRFAVCICHGLDWESL